MTVCVALSLVFVSSAAVPEPGSLGMALAVLPAFAAVSYFVRRVSQQKQEVFR